MGYLQRHHLKQAAAVIQQGGVIAYPTEAVFGLGCDPHNGEAVHRILQMKRRPAAKGLILIAASIEQLEPFVDFSRLSEQTMHEIQDSWPGPNTWLIPAKKKTPSWLRGKHATLAVRITAHPIAKGLCEAANSAIVSTSANISNHPSAKSGKQCRFIFREKLDHIVAGEVDLNAQPSTIRDALTGKIIRA